jgi:hypothetical protein
VSGAVTLPDDGLVATPGRSLVLPATLREVPLILAAGTSVYLLREEAAA